VTVTKAGVVKFLWLAGTAYVRKDPEAAVKAIKLLRKAAKKKRAKASPKDERPAD
jgi:hypothetical protein